MKKLKLFIFILVFIPYSLHSDTIDNYDFSPLDKIIEQAINNRSFPSASLIVGSDKDILYQNYYGRLTYDEASRPTSINTIYDLASITKVIATTAAIMKLYDEGRIGIYDLVVKYVPEFNNNNKSDITIQNLLLHNSGLIPFVPFYKTMTTPDEVKNYIYNAKKTYPTGSKFEYSDLNMVILGIIVERISGQKLNEYTKEKIYRPLGMYDTDFLIPLSEDYRIAPTEQDNYWRKQLLVGYVHDETAAMLEGIAGNAGIFSTASDVYKFMKMMINRGLYSNDRSNPNKIDTMFRPETVDLFTTKVSGLGYQNKRALGWDTKPIPTSYRPPCGDRFSDDSFGHTGYTGTSIWADKEKKLVVIFLTNRVYPSRENNAIRNIRPIVHDEACRIVGH